jgi:hypothetical protein
VSARAANIRHHYEQTRPLRDKVTCMLYQIKQLMAIILVAVSTAHITQHCMK